MGSEGTQVAPANEPLDSPVLKYRIEGIRESAKRARLAFLASTIASLCIFIAEYNAYLSWYFWRITLSKPEAVDADHFKKLLELYDQNTVINVSLLGIRIGEGDLVVLGSLTLFVFSIWLYFSMKTYSGLITRLIEDTEGRPDVKELVFAGIFSFLVFPTVTFYNAFATEKGIGRWLQKLTVVVLYMLPAAAVCFVLLTDLLSLSVLPAPFAANHNLPLWPQLKPDSLKTTARIFIGIGVVILAFVIYPCIRTIRLDYSTALRIRRYE